MSKYKVPTIQELIDAGAHFGHQVKRWHPKMEKYIYSVNKNVHIIDLEETEKLLKKACDFMYEQAKQGKKVIFVGTKKQSKEIIELEAKRSGAMYVIERWIGGTITNYKTIRKNLDKLLNLIKGKEDGSFDKYTKKERLMIDREIEKMEKVYGGIVSLKGVPDVLFVVDPKREKTSIREARSVNIPVVALVDTNADPSGINYVIPGNDDAIKSVAVIVKAISSALEEGYKEFDKAGKKNDIVEPVKPADTEAATPIVKVTSDEGHVDEIVIKEIEKTAEAELEKTPVKETIEEKSETASEDKKKAKKAVKEK